MRKPYSEIELPSWVKTATKEQLIDHIKYLTHTKDIYKRQLSKARYRYTKAEKLLKGI